MPRYMLSVWHDEDYEIDFSSEDAIRRFGQVDLLNQELIAAESLVFGAGLQPRTEALVMRPDGTDVVTFDGPYVESKEHIGGFWIIEADDLDTAKDWCKRAAAACEGPVELRTLQSD